MLVQLYKRKTNATSNRSVYRTVFMYSYERNCEKRRKKKEQTYKKA